MQIIEMQTATITVAIVGTPATMPDHARCVSVGVVQLAKGSKGA